MKERTTKNNPSLLSTRLIWQVSGLVLSILLVSVTVIVAANKPSRKATSQIKAVAPQNAVVRGVISEIGENQLVIQKADRTTHQIGLDQHTTVLRDNVEFSFANMSLIATTPEQLQVGDYVEVVAAVQKGRYLGRIITQVTDQSPTRQWVAGGKSLAAGK